MIGGYISAVAVARDEREVIVSAELSKEVVCSRQVGSEVWIGLCTRPVKKQDDARVGEQDIEFDGNSQVSTIMHYINKYVCRFQALSFYDHCCVDSTVQSIERRASHQPVHQAIAA